MASSIPSKRLAGAAVYNAEVDDRRVILDLATESYYVLDETASAFWSVLTQTDSLEEAFTALAARFSDAPNQLRDDVEAFMNECLERGFLRLDAVDPRQTADPPSSAPPRSVRTGHSASAWLVLRAAGCLLWTHLTLKHLGFRAVHARSTTLRRAARRQKLDRVCAAFLAAENLYLSRRAPDDCLLRSFALFRFMRMCGLPAEHVIGVRRIPFAVHAWVECEGRVVLDDSPVRVGMTPLARVVESA